MSFEKLFGAREQEETERQLIERMLTEDYNTAVRALRAVGASVVVDRANHTMVTATMGQLKNAQEWVPDEVYHGSPNAAIETLVPQRTTERDEPDTIYASPSIEVALFSTLNRQKGVGGGIVNGRRFVYISVPKDEYLASQQPACIYTLPGSKFRTNGRIGLGRLELVSSEAVSPIHQEHINDPLQRVIDAGIEVYFVTETQAGQIRSAQEQSPEELEKILEQLTSENENEAI